MKHQDWLYQQKKRAAKQASIILAKEDLVIWDSETCGLDYGSPFVQLGAIDRDGNTLLHEYMDPQIPIPEGAIKIHGIQDKTVIGSPSFIELIPKLRSILHMRSWCVYNIDYDFSRILIPQLRLYASRYYIEPKALPRQQDGLQEETHCLMHLYAAFWGDYSQYHSSFTWQSLRKACEQQNIILDAPYHNSLADCQRSLALLKHLAQWYENQKGIIINGKSSHQ